MIGTNTERYTTYSFVDCNVGVGVDVAMGVMVGVAHVAVRESVVATKWKQRNMVKMYFHGLHVYILHVQLPSEQLLIPPTGSRAIMWSRTSLKA